MRSFLWITVCCVFCCISSSYSQKLACGFPGSPANGSVTPHGSAFVLNATVRYSCAVGYILFGDEQRACQKNGSWSHEIPVCDTNVARSKHATQSGQFRQQKASLAVDSDPSTCSSTPKTPSERWWQLSLGYPYQVTMVAVTISVGVWHKFSVYVVSAEGDNRIIYNLCGSFEGVFEFSMVEIKCNNETGMSGEYIFIRDNRPGSFQLTLCEVEVFAYRDDRPCGEPEVPLHGTVTRLNETVCEYGCQSGFTLDGGSRFKCVDGVWESPPPVCKDLFCPAPLPIRGAKFTPIYAEWFPPPDKSSYPYGTLLNYTCEQGFVTEMVGTLICSDAAVWVGTRPSCLPTDCGPPPIVPNATFRFLNLTQPTKTNSMVHLKCDDGYYLTDGNPISRCLRGGNWSSINATCRVIPAAGSREGDGVQPALGVVLAIVMALIALLLAVLVIMYLRRRDQLKRAFPMISTSAKPTTEYATGGGGGVGGATASSSGVIVKQQTPANDPDLYDDVWNSNEALASEAQDTLYTDAVSSSEDLMNESVIDRIYDHPEGDDADDDHVYYSPAENVIGSECETSNTGDRSHLPPADGASESALLKLELGSSINNNGSEHIYEPLRRSTSPNGTVLPLRPVYAKVDLALKKQKRGDRDDGDSSNDSDAQITVENGSLRPQPEGVVTYTVPVFDSTKTGGGSNNNNSGNNTNTNNNNNNNAVGASSQRPLPPIPPDSVSVSSVMVDNSLYGGQSSRNSWGLLAENELYDGISVTSAAVS